MESITQTAAHHPMKDPKVRGAIGGMTGAGIGAGLGGMKAGLKFNSDVGDAITHSGVGGAAGAAIGAGLGYSAAKLHNWMNKRDRSYDKKQSQNSQETK